MINVTGSDTYPTNVAYPADGDPVTASTLGSAPIALANRTTKLAADIAAIAMTDRSGVRRIREAGSTTALAALTGMANGDLALVPGVGLYRYYTSGSAASLPATAHWVIVPGAGVGRWLHQLFAIASAPNGLPVLDSSARLTGDIGTATVMVDLIVHGGGALHNYGSVVVETTGALSVNGAQTVDGSLTLSGSSATTFAANSTVSDASTRTQTGRTTVSGDGNVAWRLVTAPDADTVYGAVSGTGIVGADEVHVGAVTTGRVYSLTTTGAASGNRIRFVRTAGTNSIGAGGNWLSTTTSAAYTWIEYTFNGTAWVKSAWHLIP